MRAGTFSSTALSVFRVVCVLLGIVGTTFLVPLVTALACGEQQVLLPFAVPMLCSWITAAAGFFLGHGRKTTLSTRGAFAVVALGWISASLFGAVPLYASGAIPSVTDAVFESVSGFSTTGASILSDIEALPRSINLWRCQTHWLGGMGIVALTVALLPILGVGGFQLIKAETTGPEKGKLTPKITTTAKVLWFIYMGMTAVQALLLRLAGMDWIDAVSHAFSTLGTGGFSTRNASIGAYNSPAIDCICTVFMFLAGINFSLYFYAFTGKFADVRKDSELRAYLLVVFAAVLFVTCCNLPTYGGLLNSLRYSAFQVLSILSTAGFATDDFTTWVPAAQLVIFALFLIGGCSGSTGGGIKVIRWVILGKQLHNEILRMLHPHGVFTVRINKRAGRKDVVFTVTAFMFLYVLLVSVTSLFTTLFGLDIFSSFTGAMSMIGNIGPGFNQLGPSHNFGFLPAAVKWWYSLMMITGRLEFYTIVIFFVPSFWRK